MKTKNTQILIIGLILASFLIGAYLYPHMPEKMASHWDANGREDGYISRFWGIFLMPVISTILFLVFILIPKLQVQHHPAPIASIWPDYLLCRSYDGESKAKLVHRRQDSLDIK